MKNRLKLWLAALAGLLLVSALLAGSVRAAPGDTTLVSVASDGTQGNGPSSVTAISADGRYVAFQSRASNLVSGDTNRVADIFVHDRQTGLTTRVSVASDGTQSNGESYWVTISFDGRYVAFDSYASNLVGGDTNNTSDVFVHDRQTGITTRVSIASDGTEGDSSSVSPAFSGDGRYVAFASDAENLVSGDTNGATDTFVHDLQTGMTTRVSVASDGTEGNLNSDYPSMSSDGRYVTFESDADNLVNGDTNNAIDIFVHDRQTGVTTRVSLASDGTQANQDCRTPVISGNGRYVVYWSPATNLVDGDTNGKYDVFVRDRQIGLTSRVSVASDGTQGNGDSLYFFSMSADGRYVVFVSGASNLVRNDTNTRSDVFMHDMQAGLTTLVSLASDGSQGDGDTYQYPSITADGHYVAFQSLASNLVSGDTNGVLDVFVHEIGVRAPTPTPRPASAPAPAALPATGFAPERVTRLPAQPAGKAYSTDSGLTLDIPTLGIKAAVVGVPRSADGWDVTWLGKDAGYLEGTAFPTWNGDSVIAGHVWDADNKPGPFLNLKQLKYGDPVRIHGWGQVYTYQVRENALVWPDDTASVLKHEEGAWVTLLTCEDFNLLFDRYTYRRIVRAVLVSVDAEK